MWPLIWAAGRAYAPYIVFPAALVVGTVGYMIESRVSNKDRGKQQERSALEQRGERLLEQSNNPADIPSLKYKSHVPTSVLDKNLENPDAYR